MLVTTLTLVVLPKRHQIRTMESCPTVIRFTNWNFVTFWYEEELGLQIYGVYQVCRDGIQFQFLLKVTGCSRILRFEMFFSGFKRRSSAGEYFLWSHGGKVRSQSMVVPSTSFVGICCRIDLDSAFLLPRASIGGSSASPGLTHAEITLMTYFDPPGRH